MKKNLYEILGVARDAGTEDIRAAHEAALAGPAGADEVRRLALKEAYGVLSHPQRRAAYDATLNNRSAAAGSSLGQRMERSHRGTGVPRLWLSGGAVLLVALGLWWLLRPGPAAAPKTRTPADVATQSTTVRSAPVILAAPTPAAEPAPSAVPVATSLSPEQLFATASRSVVRLNVMRRDGALAATGSGVVIGPGRVVTNCHVALAGDTVQVRLGSERFDASVDIADEEMDLCRLSVRGLMAEAVQVGSVQGLHVGQRVFAIGSPHGLDLTLSDGLVSSLRQTPYGPVIQTSAPVSPGSSGGGLFAADGRLVGIVTFQVRDGQNLNFALPADWLEKMTNRPSSSRN